LNNNWIFPHKSVYLSLGVSHVEIRYDKKMPCDENHKISFNMTISNAKSLTLGNPVIYLWTALFVAGNVLFPQLCHMMPDGGKALLPIMLFTLIAAARFGIYAGLMTALLSPLASFLIFGTPEGTILAAVLTKSMVIALVFGLWKSSGRTFNYGIMLLLILGVQLFCFVIEGAFMSGFATAWSDLLLSWPGMLLQLLGGMFVVKYWK